MASVKIMLSYNYCHFEICLSTGDSDIEPIDEQVNQLRKRAQRLADEAVRQYAKSKRLIIKRAEMVHERKRIEDEVARIKEHYPKSEWNDEQKAKVKSLEDKEYWEQHNYDYDDDWEA